MQGGVFLGVSTSLLVIFAAAGRPAKGDFSDLDQPRCERITVDMCKKIPYNYTRMPVHGHYTQEDVSTTLQQFKPLIDVGCSQYLTFFLCSVFTPMCDQTVDQTISSCRSICLDVQRSCLPILKEFGLDWPAPLDCSKLLERGNDKELCMQPDFINRNKSGSNGAGGANSGGLLASTGSSEILGGAGGSPNSKLSCRSSYVPADNSKKGACVASCHADLMFTKEDKDFAQIWITVWASLCLLVTGFTVLTFALDRSRFEYPERPIIFLAMCYNIYALAHVVRLFLGRERISCAENAESHCLHVIKGGLESSECVIIFLLLYYFSLASAIWWVVLTFTWFLSAGLKWGKEGIDSLSSYFHLVAWAVPAVLSIAVLVLKKVDGDELTGLCFVGNTDSNALLAFVLAPLSVFLAIGCIFMLTCMLYMCRIKKLLSADQQRFESLLVRIGVLSILYFLAEGCVIACYAYGKANTDNWAPYPMPGCKPPAHFPPKPRVEVYMLRIFMSLIVGIISGMWIFSRKTLATWKRLLTCKLLSVDPNRAKQLPSTPAHSHNYSSTTGTHQQIVNGFSPSHASYDPRKNVYKSSRCMPNRYVSPESSSLASHVHV